MKRKCVAFDETKYNTFNTIAPPNTLKTNGKPLLAWTTSTMTNKKGLKRSWKRSWKRSGNKSWRRSGESKVEPKNKP